MSSSENKPTVPFPTSVAGVVETFAVQPNPTPTDVVNMLARLAAFINAYMAEALRSKVISAANPASAALMNSSSTLEQGSLQLRALIQQQQQGAFGGGTAPAPGGFPGQKFGAN